MILVLVVSWSHCVEPSELVALRTGAADDLASVGYFLFAEGIADERPW